MSEETQEEVIKVDSRELRSAVAGTMGIDFNSVDEIMYRIQGNDFEIHHLQSLIVSNPKPYENVLGENFGYLTVNDISGFDEELMYRLWEATTHSYMDWVDFMIDWQIETKGLDAAKAWAKNEYRRFTLAKFFQECNKFSATAEEVNSLITYYMEISQKFT